LVSSEVIGRIVEKLGANDLSLTEVRWAICILGEGPENYNSSRCEKRTFVRYATLERLLVAFAEYSRQIL